MSKNPVKSTMFPHLNIHKYTWTSPDGKTHKHTDHIWVDSRWYSSILDVQSFRGADCDTDHYLLVAKVRERVALSKQAAQMFDGERFNPRKEMSWMLGNSIRLRLQTGAALGNLSDDKNINRAWENIKENIKTLAKERLGLYKLKQDIPWFDEECLHFLD